LSVGVIDLWWFRMPEGWPGAPEVEQAALSLLDRAETERFRGFANPAAARFFAYRRAARRLILAERVGVRPEHLAFDSGPGGKPRLAGETGLTEFSATDSGTTGVLAICANGPVGVDLEFDRMVDASRLAERVLSPAERAAYLDLSPHRQAEWILGIWISKEALVKAMGTGLDLAAFRQMTVPQAPKPEDWRPVKLGRRLARRGGWQLCFRVLPGGGLIAVATREAAEIRLIDAAPLLAWHGLG